MSIEGARILVVEDEEAIAEGLVFNLKRRGFHADLAEDGHRALQLASEARYDLILLDVRLPGPDGFEVCRRLRAARDFTPILILTARTEADDIVRGLQVGADDYVAKPFDLAELMARVEGMLRRQGWSRAGEPAARPEGEDAEQAGEPESRYAFGEFWVDFKTFKAQTRQGIVELSRKEIAAMRLFVERPNEVITRRELLAEVWELPNHPNTRVVDNVIVALRRAFEENSWRPQHIHSVRGVGYRFVP